MIPPASTSQPIRTQVAIPLRFGDGYATSARAFTFEGLVDGGEHLALRLGRAPAAARGDRHRPWSACTASA